MWVRLFLGLSWAVFTSLTGGCSAGVSQGGVAGTNEPTSGRGGATGVGGAPSADSGSANSDAGSPACQVGDDSWCSADSTSPWLSGVCLATGRCGDCSIGYVPNADSGQCDPAPEHAELGTHLYAIAAASRSHDAAILYVDGQTSVFQAIDPMGRAVGEPVTLFSAPEATRALSIGLASDGTRYLACTSDDAETDCVFVAPGTEPVPAYHVLGIAPSVAFGHAEWVLAYQLGTGQAAQTGVQRIGTDGALVGKAALFPAENSGLYKQAPLAATPQGFALVTGEPEKLYRLDRDLEVVGAPWDLGMNFWTFGAVAATDSMIAVSLSLPYGATLFWGSNDDPPTRVSMSGGGKLGLPMALLPNGDAISVAWNDGSLAYEAEVPRVQPRDATMLSATADPVAMVSVEEQVLVADLRGGFAVRVQRLR
ncbi:MAG: hypothetical protein ABIQ16_04965 [Polyangiaceae bacterium]